MAFLLLRSKSWRKKSKKSVSKKEEKLLKQLKHITQVIQDGRLEIGSPEMEAEEVPYAADWEGQHAVFRTYRSPCSKEIS